MTQFKGFLGLSEAQLRQTFSFLFKQDSVGLTTDGVLTGLSVAQTASPSAAVIVAAGAAVVQDSVLNGVTPLVLDTTLPAFDVLTANPLGGLPRNDIIAFDAATLASGTGGIVAIIGTPNASPTDPTVPATAIALARLRHAASATTIPTAKIDDLRVFTNLNDGRSSAVTAKRFHWGKANVTTDASGYANVTHGAGFTPTTVVIIGGNPTVQNNTLGTDTFGATTFRIRSVSGAGAAVSGPVTVNYFCGE